MMSQLATFPKEATAGATARVPTITMRIFQATKFLPRKKGTDILTEMTTATATQRRPTGPIIQMMILDITTEGITITVLNTRTGTDRRIRETYTSC